MFCQRVCKKSKMIFPLCHILASRGAAANAFRSGGASGWSIYMIRMRLTAGSWCKHPFPLKPHCFSFCNFNTCNLTFWKMKSCPVKLVETAGDKIRKWKWQVQKLIVAQIAILFCPSLRFLTLFWNPVSLFVDTTQPHQVNLTLVNFISEKQTQDQFSLVWIYLTQATETLVWIL